MDLLVVLVKGSHYVGSKTGGHTSQVLVGGLVGSIGKGFSVCRIQALGHKPGLIVGGLGSIGKGFSH